LVGMFRQERVRLEYLLDESHRQISFKNLSFRAKSRSKK
jgi:hypothetical protein